MSADDLKKPPANADITSGVFPSVFAQFAQPDFRIAHKKGLPPAMTVDRRPFCLIRIGRGERI